MRVVRVASCFLTFFTYPLYSNDSVDVSDYKIAVVVREAVRAADSNLLNASSLAAWRDHLKVAATNLQLPMQPLMLIKFDEDAKFRNQLKTIIEWEKQWRKNETEYFIYYYRWDQPPPEIIVHVQDAHHNAIARLFQVKVEEKIPFRYDLLVEENTVYPFEDLRGGIVSSQPFDLYRGSWAILNSINPEPQFLLEPLSKIYGSYFQDPITSKAFYDLCSKEIAQQGYVSAAILLEKKPARGQETVEAYSAYAFVYDLDKEFGPRKISEFLSSLGKDITGQSFKSHFAEIFGVSMAAFEGRYRFSAQK
ncbi:hypothetical protein MJD09_02130 [bacterium]|nr:hypothetical protein [bacterium]